MTDDHQRFNLFFDQVHGTVTFYQTRLKAWVASRNALLTEEHQLHG
ncbi:hypothetical protein OH492_05050 [Vibrio chagasii]|nr:hypothetical protein [Vibrio chagasii]